MMAANGRPLKSLLKFQRTVDDSGNRRSDRDSRVARPNKPQRNERIEPTGYACYRIISDFHNTYWIDRAYARPAVSRSEGQRQQGNTNKSDRIGHSGSESNIREKRRVAAGVDTIWSRFKRGTRRTARGQRRGGCNCIRGRELRFANCILILSGVAAPSTLGPDPPLPMCRWKPTPARHAATIRRHDTPPRYAATIHHRDHVRSENIKYK